MNNDCPICNAPMLFSPRYGAASINSMYDTFHCPKLHYVVFLALTYSLTHYVFEDKIIIDPYWIYRDKNKTMIYKDSCRIATINYVIPIKKYDTVEKIERLLLLS